MSEPTSYFSRPYAAAWGILIGLITGIPLALMFDSTVIPTLTLAGLLIGYVLSQQGGRPADDAESRLQKLEDLRSQSLITDDEYQNKRREILSKL